MKRALSLLLALFLCAALASCAAQKTIDDPAALAEALYTADIYSTDLYPLSADMITATFGVTLPYATAYAYATAGDAADEIAVIEAADANAAEAILAQLDAHRVSFSALYATYAPDQCPRIDGALLMRVGNVVIFCTSNSTDSAKTIVESYAK